MFLLIATIILLAFIAGVAEANRVIRELHIISGEIHARIADLETTIKGKL